MAWKRSTPELIRRFDELAAVEGAAANTRALKALIKKAVAYARAR
jgi:hypothetical protein